MSWRNSTIFDLDQPPGFSNGYNVLRYTAVQLSERELFMISSGKLLIEN